MNIPPIHVNTPVWGQAYTRCFVEVGLPSLLADGNLPCLNRNQGHLLHVMTTEVDRKLIEASESWRRAQCVIDCHIDVIGTDAVRIANPHQTMSDCHREAIRFADRRNAAIMLYNPDIVLADGGMRSLVRLLAQGKRAVQVVGLRILKEEAVPLLLNHHVQGNGSVISIEPRNLMKIAMQHLHPLMLMHLYDAPEFDLMPQELFWKVGEEGIVARCFHIHPILVYPRVRNAPFSTTVDDDYLRSACPDPKDEHFISDSDEFCLCELSGLQRNLHGLPRTQPDMDVARWAFAHARPHHFEHLCRRILLHAGIESRSALQSAIAKSDHAVKRILLRAVELGQET